MSELKHNGVAITVDSGGKFRATIGDKSLSADTMATIQKKIDAMKPFEAFDVIQFGYNNDLSKYEIVKCTGIKKATRHHNKVVLFIGGHHGEREWVSVIRATPENIALADEARAMCIKNNEIREKLDEEEGVLEEKLRLLKERPPADV